MLSGLWTTAWLLLLLHWGRMTALCCLDYGRLRDCCCCFIGAVWLRSVFGTMGDCVTAAAASSGPYDCAMLSGLWTTAWLLLLLHWGRMTALCCLDYGRLRDCCCCCFIGAVWRRSVFGTMADCVTAAAASLGPYDCILCSGLWATAWLLLLLHWGRMTAICCLDYGRLRDCCCCFIGAVWLRCVVWTMGDCVTAAAASLGPYDGVPCSGLWPTAWLLLLLHWGRMTVFCVRDYGRLRDCCCCFIGAVWLYSVFGTMADCVTAAAASLGPYDCDMLAGYGRLQCVTAAAAYDVSGMLAKTGHHCGADAADIGTEAVWPQNWWLTAVRTAWLLLLSQWGQPDGRVLYGNRENIVRGAATAWVMLLPAGTACVQSVVWSAWLMLLLH